jgi:hemoglobin
MKPDISTREDIHYVITEFYKKLVSDKMMLPFFEEIVRKKELNHHIDVITDFWQDILLNTNTYRNNVLQKHLDFHEKVVFEKAHFTKWLQYISISITNSFEGQTSQNMIDRAKSIAMVMQVKLKVYD